ncbi:MAG TPA: deoxyhypusine synthase [Candidatus Nanoarchaeia archaeon]|nr:deoxyhypusine synthase [Candidatus Nanoarchaeia archaeon]
MAVSKARKAVMKRSSGLPKGCVTVKGYDFNADGKSGKVNYSKLLDSYLSTGFQASQFAKAVEIIREMRKSECTIYLGYTSNMVSSGLREIIRYLAQHKLVDVIVTTVGGVEEDLIKTWGDFGVSFEKQDDNALREKGINRMANILVPNSGYTKFEDWINPLLDRISEEQRSGKIHTASELIAFLGKNMKSEESIYNWASKNNIPVFCPAIMDGSLGDMIHFFSYNKPIRIDAVRDAHILNDFTMKQQKTGIIILGGGVVKHHICNANLMRDGADFAVYINNASEFDGSNAGAGPEEAVSWGKIAQKGKSVKVFGDAILLFPLIAAKAFVEK